MPDHLRLLAEGIDAQSKFTEFVRVFTRSAFHWKAACGGDLWQRSYFERISRSEESTIEVARYVLANVSRLT